MVSLLYCLLFISSSHYLIAGVESKESVSDVLNEKNKYSLEFESFFKDLPTEMLSQLFQELPYLSGFCFKDFSDEVQQCSIQLKNKKKTRKQLLKLRDKFSYNRIFWELITYELCKIAYLEKDIAKIILYRDELGLQCCPYIYKNILKMCVNMQIKNIDKYYISDQEYENILQFIQSFSSEDALQAFKEKYRLCMKKAELKTLCINSSVFVVDHIWNLIGHSNDSIYSSEESKLLTVEFLLNQKNKELKEDAYILFKDINVDLLEPECLSLYNDLFVIYFNE